MQRERDREKEQEWREGDPSQSTEPGAPWDMAVESVASISIGM